MTRQSKHFAAFEREHRQGGETIVCWAPAHRDKEGFEGAVILTDRRVVYFRKGTLSTKQEPWPIAKISSVEARKGLLFYDVTLHTSGDKMVLRITDKAMGAELVEKLQAAISAPSEPAAAAHAAEGPADQLRKLGELRDAGIVTEEEFAAKKAELLARI